MSNLIDPVDRVALSRLLADQPGGVHLVGDSYGGAAYLKSRTISRRAEGGPSTGGLPGR